MTGINSLILAAVVGAAFTLGVSGQDLGSSNKLFGGSSEAKARPAAKSSPRKPVSAAKPKAVSRTVKKVPPVRRPQRTAAPETAAAEKPRMNYVAMPAERYNEIVADARAAHARGDVLRAKELYSTAFSGNRVAPDAAVGLASIFAAELKWMKAERYVREAAENGVANGEAYLLYSKVLARPVLADDLSERFDKAENFARRAVSLMPNDARTHIQLGRVLELKGIIGPETESEYRTALRIGGTSSPAAKALIARLARKRGDATNASAQYRDAAAEAVSPAQKADVAEVLQEDGRYADSLPLLRSASENDRRNAVVLTKIARAQMADGSLADAERTLLIATSLVGDSPDVAELLASDYLREGKLTPAMQAIRPMAAFAEGYERTSLARVAADVGDAFAKRGDRTSATAAFKLAADLDTLRDPANGKVRSTGKY